MSVKKLKRFGHNEIFDSSLFTCLNYKYTLSVEKDYIQIAAFDPGVVNTGCRIEKRQKNLDNQNVIAKTIKQQLFKSGTKDSTEHYFITMRNHLKSIEKELSECDYILVESQMRTNPEAIRMSQHIISTILGIIDNNNSKALLIEILPTVKSRAFGQKGLKGKDLKAWAVEKSLAILSERGDFIGETLIKEAKKKDDHADVVLYCDAWYRYLETNKFEP